MKYTAKRNGNKIVRLTPTSVKSYCSNFGGKLTVIEKAKERIVYEPPYYPDGKECEHVFDSHEIYIAELYDVLVHGGTGLIVAGHSALTDICENDAENRVKYSSGAIRRGNKKQFYLEVSDVIEEVDVAIDLCGLAAFNYYHLTFEILSRYEYIKNIEGNNSNVIVLLDEDARKYPQYVDLIHAVLEKANIRYVPQFKMVHCKRLIYPSMNTWMPMNVRRKNDFRMSDNLVAQSAVDNIRKATEKYRLDKNGTKKIFISRKTSSFSRIVNEAEVAKLFEKAGYLVVCTESLSYKEQVELFSSTACIVGASGAALTNLVYCNPEAVFGCIIPKKYEFCIYSSIAHMVGCECLYLDAKIAKAGRAISTDQCRVELRECEEYIMELDKLIN